MNLLKVPWHSENGDISVEAVRQKHQPGNAFRVGRSRYLPNDYVSVTSRLATIYVVSGTYRFQRRNEPDLWHEISEGFYAVVPAGEFMVYNLDPRGAEIVYAIEIPEQYRITNGE